ncbi:hypothetical protein LEN26_006998 [Aphanomyces euteiches]|nr:hypothetical protein LEN26_006998 [Aphanomyces euteiches]KAH9190321.1 hypothetical protein AeNC1_007708 [Aphanomyces euteiches]
MHHELFMALLGICGELIVEKRDPKQGNVTTFGFDVNASPMLLANGDRQLLQPILHLGFCYRKLARFARRASLVAAPADEYITTSLYVHSVRQSISKTLVSYEAHVGDMEEHVLEKARPGLHAAAMLPFSHLLVEMRQELEVFPFLCQLVEQIESRNLKGKDVLELLQSHDHSGFPQVQEHARQYLANAHRVLYRQMMSWMATAHLVDPYGEFFITMMESGENAVDLSRVPLRYFPSSIAENVLFIGNAMKILGDSKTLHQNVITVLHTLSAQPTWSSQMVEHILDKLRLDIASALGDRVVVQGQFVKWLHGIKSFYLLGEGDFYHAVLEKASQIMQLPPTKRSEIDLNHGIWASTLREYKLDSPFSISLEVPVQSFSYFRMHNAQPDLILVGSSQQPDSTGLEAIVTAPKTPLTCWHRHIQYISRSFQTSMTITMPDTPTEVSFVLQTDGTQAVPSIQDGQVSFKSNSFVSLQFQFHSITDNACYVTAKLWTQRESQIILHQATTSLDYSPEIEILVEYDVINAQRIMHGWRVHAQATCFFEFSMNLSAELEAFSGRKGGVFLGLVLLPGMNVQQWSFEKVDDDPWAYTGLSMQVEWPLPLLLTPSSMMIYNHMFQLLFRLKRVIYALNQTWKNMRGYSTPACLLRHDIIFVLSNLFFYYQMAVVEAHFNQCVMECEKTSDFDAVKRLHENFVAALAKKSYLYAATVMNAIDQVIALGWAFCANPSIEMLGEYESRTANLCKVLSNTDAQELVILIDFNGYLMQHNTNY